jgi:small subunit ribosomal protein S21
MIVVNVKENESIDRALKRFKKKFERTRVLREVRARAYYEKPSVSRRNAKIKAAYKQKMYAKDNY